MLSVRVLSQDELKTPLLERLESFEMDAFGEAGMDRWSMPVYARYGALYIMEIDDEVAGLAGVLYSLKEMNTAYLYGLQLERGVRGKGYGALFLTELVEDLRKRGISALELTVSAENKAAMVLYKKSAFRRIGEFKDFYGKGEDRILMRLEL